MRKISIDDFKAWGKAGGIKSAKALTKAQRVERARKAGLAKRKAKK